MRKQLVVGTKVYAAITACIGDISTCFNFNVTDTRSPNYIGCRTAAGDVHYRTAVDRGRVRRAATEDVHSTAADGCAVCRAAAGDVHAAAVIDGGAVRHTAA